MGKTPKRGIIYNPIPLLQLFAIINDMNDYIKFLTICLFSHLFSFIWVRNDRSGVSMACCNKFDLPSNCNIQISSAKNGI